MVEIRRLRATDIDAMLRLCALAGWNQTAQDVARFLALAPDGCFAACVGDLVVGTTTTTAYGTDLAWVGMVLVDPDFRRRGIATTLMETALRHLDRLGVRTVKLDATPAGRLVYERLGFVTEHVFERWSGPAPAACAPASEGTWDEIAEADRLAFGADRGALLRGLIADAGPPLLTRNAQGHMTAYAFRRPGTRAGYVGPVLADDAETAGIVLSAAAARLGGSVFIDIDPAFPRATGLMERLGFARQRELIRMRRGEQGPTTSFRVFAIAGPAVG
ncbi:MAG: GNAT family N-acetyltransferase [Zavarzinella sp.]|nr:GNAT family N-acetyltransferase [Zavarzinella sp.]